MTVPHTIGNIVQACLFTYLFMWLLDVPLSDEERQNLAGLTGWQREGYGIGSPQYVTAAAPSRPAPPLREAPGS